MASITNNTSTINLPSHYRIITDNIEKIIIINCVIRQDNSYKIAKCLSVKERNLRAVDILYHSIKVIRDNKKALAISAVNFYNLLLHE